MTAHWKQTEAQLVPGHQVASGKSQNSPFPAGTIALQKPVFRALGLDLETMHSATLNLSIGTGEVVIRQPDYHFTGVKWLTTHHPEDFSFVSCVVSYQEQDFASWIYLPHPETKSMHYQQKGVIEVLAPFIEGIQYGDPLTLHYDPHKLAISED